MSAPGRPKRSSPFERSEKESSTCVPGRPKRSSPFERSEKESPTCAPGLERQREGNR